MKEFYIPFQGFTTMCKIIAEPVCYSKVLKDNGYVYILSKGWELK